MSRNADTSGAPLPPRPAPGAAPASWLTGRVGLTSTTWVTGTVGTGFDAYARIFHPLDDKPGSSRWADVAAANRRVMHPSAQWDHVSCPPGSAIPQQPSGRGFPGEPDYGNLRAVSLAPLVELLAAHTADPGRCWFGLWNGWGWWDGPGAVLTSWPRGTTPTPVKHAPPEWQLDRRAPTLDLPWRRYLLFEGAVGDALRFGHWVTADWFEAQSPSLFWPDDHSWCVATEVDFDSTLVGGSRALIDAIVSSSSVEALPIAADAPYEDRVNT